MFQSYENIVKELRSDWWQALAPTRRKVVYAAADAIGQLSKLLDAVNDAHNEGYDVGYWAVRRDYEPKWVSAKERLPEKRKWVLCWCVSNTQEVLRWENNEWYHDPQHVYFGDFVTHWMPLPEPPMEEK